MDKAYRRFELELDGSAVPASRHPVVQKISPLQRESQSIRPMSPMSAIQLPWS